MTELIKIRIELLKQMNTYIDNNAYTEGAYYAWKEVFPDNATDNDFKEIASNPYAWKDVCILFGSLLNECA